MICDRLCTPISALYWHLHDLLEVVLFGPSLLVVESRRLSVDPTCLHRFSKYSWWSSPRAYPFAPASCCGHELCTTISVAPLADQAMPFRDGDHARQEDIL